MAANAQETAPPGKNPEAPDAPGARKRPARWPIFVLLAIAIIIPAVFWRQVWFGRALSDEEIRYNLTHPEESRRLQHACEQISRRMQSDPQDAAQF